MLQMGTLRPTEARCVAQGHADWGLGLGFRPDAACTPWPDSSPTGSVMLMGVPPEQGTSRCDQCRHGWVPDAG